MEIKVEPGIAIPGKKRGSGIVSVMREMKIGDSFVYPLHKRSDITPLAQRSGITTTTRKVSDTEIRVWRIA